MGEVIGDGLIKLPFIASLKDAFPDASIHWCAAKGSTVYTGALKPIVEGLIDEVIDGGVTGVRVSDLLLLREPFAGRRFDVVIDTQTNVRRTLVIKRARAQGGVFVSPAADFRFSDIKRKAPWPEAMVDRLQTLASFATGRRIEARPVALTDRRALAAAAALLPDGPRYIGFAPGAGGVVKRWPLDRYIALAAAQEGASRTPVFFLGPDEVEMAGRVRAALPKAIFPELGRTDVVPGCKGSAPGGGAGLAPRRGRRQRCWAWTYAGGGGRAAPVVAARPPARNQVPSGGAATEAADRRGFPRRRGARHGSDFPGRGGAGAERPHRRRALMPILIPVSAGELVDKLTILRVKAARIDPSKRANVEKELVLLEAVAARELAAVPGLEALTAELEAVNAALWDVEEGKRDCERRQDFGPAFIALARRVYHENDRRAAIKRRINDAAGSDLIEEKSYRPY